MLALFLKLFSRSLNKLNELRVAYQILMISLVNMNTLGTNE